MLTDRLETILDGGGTPGGPRNVDDNPLPPTPAPNMEDESGGGAWGGLAGGEAGGGAEGLGGGGGWEGGGLDVHELLYRAPH